MLKDEVDFARSSSPWSSTTDEGAEGFCRAWRYRTMLSTLPGFEDLVMIVVTPADVPNLAAMILVLIPPVPSADPALDTVSC